MFVIVRRNHYREMSRSLALYEEAVTALGNTIRVQGEVIAALQRLADERARLIDLQTVQIRDIQKDLEQLAREAEGGTLQ